MAACSARKLPRGLFSFLSTVIRHIKRAELSCYLHSPEIRDKDQPGMKPRNPPRAALLLHSMHFSTARKGLFYFPLLIFFVCIPTLGMIQFNSLMMGKCPDPPAWRRMSSFGKKWTPLEAAVCRSCHPSFPSSPQPLRVIRNAKWRGMRMNQWMNQVGSTWTGCALGCLKSSRRKVFPCSYPCVFVG